MIRLVSTYSSIIFYSIILIIIAIFSNVAGDDIPVWSEMTIVDDIYNLNILIGVTIGAGVMSLILDWSYKCCGWKTVFHSFDNTEDQTEEIEMNTVPNEVDCSNNLQPQ